MKSDGRVAFAFLNGVVVGTRFKVGSNTPDDSNIELMNKYKAVLDSGKTILPFCTSYLTQFYHIRSMYARKKKSDIIKSTNLYMVWRFQ